ncbi:MAG TPA: hypothetical protein PKE58_21885 [Acidobacteriota bacterium]|nr:hypothetical protein [Acidobacteriota bacterium]
MADVEAGKPFFESLWPEAQAVSDPERHFYDAFGRKHGTIGQFLSPGALTAGVRALFKGNFIGAPVGDPLVMPGFFLVRKDGQVVWEYLSAHTGDHPDFAKIPFQGKD